MALTAIATAISAGIQRNVAISEMKHTDKLAEVKATLAQSSLTRIDRHSERLTKARIDHYTWVSTLQGVSLDCYNTSKADLEAALAEPVASN